MLLRLCVLAVMALHVAALAVALHPNVSANYFDYFIARTTDCLVRPADGQIPPGTMATLTSGSGASQHVVVCGFAGGEKDGAWTVGHQTALRLPIATGSQDLVLRISDVFLPQAGYAQHLRVATNGQVIGEASLSTGGVQELRFPLPPSAVAASDVLEIEFDLPDASSPAHWNLSGDPRDLAIKLSSAGVVAHTQ